MYHEIAYLLAATDAQTSMSDLPLAVWLLLCALCAPAFGALSLLAIRTVARAALREELDDLRRRVDDNAAAVIDLKMHVYEAAREREGSFAPPPQAGMMPPSYPRRRADSIRRDQPHSRRNAFRHPMDS
jgi:hypothetical protein